ncbi:MFS transporter [Caldilinea sp.]|uniref:MFS transporter n=1 Tax=Caldilinea sp. TaxID=2293560 RepID=UPI002D11C38A|nr:MFS transporter [Anaerolineales bacterium]HQY93415.1 MFS transporter [Caldilinea sp.]
MNKKRLTAAAYGHFSIDILNSSVAIILTLAAVQFNLTIAQIGFGAMMYQMFAAMSQPLFGGLTDKLNGRWIGAVGVLWTALFYAAASWMPTYPLFITLLMIGGLGSGAFHAAGMVNASASGGDKAATATSYFFLGGQTGLALGPILAGFVIGGMGLAGMPLMALLAVPASVLMFMHMNDALPVAPKVVKSDNQGNASRTHAATAILITAFVLFILLRSSTAQGYATLLPKFYESAGYSAAQFGLMLGLFNLAGAMGTLIGGYLGDRFNRRTIMIVASIASVPFAYAMLYASGASYIVVAVLAGILLSMPHSLLMVMSQELAPNRRGLAGGLVLGFIFASGSFMAWLQSIAAEQVGLLAVLSVVAFFPFFAGLVGFALPSSRKPHPAIMPPPTASSSAAAD